MSAEPAPPTHHDPIADAKAQEANHQFTFRAATSDDIPALQDMIGTSLRGLGSAYYTQKELDGSIGWLFGPDTVLLRVCIFFTLRFWEWGIGVGGR